MMQDTSKDYGSINLTQRDIDSALISHNKYGSREIEKQLRIIDDKLDRLEDLIRAVGAIVIEIKER